MTHYYSLLVHSHYNLSSLNVSDALCINYLKKKVVRSEYKCCNLKLLDRRFNRKENNLQSILPYHNYPYLGENTIIGILSE